MVQLTIAKNERIGFTVYFIFENEEMSHWEFDTYEQALKKFKGLTGLI